MSFRSAFYILILIFGLNGLLIGGCSSTPFDENDPAALYHEAEEDIQSDHYQIAIDKLRAIKNKFPYSKFAIEAQLRIADVYYLQESYAEAASAYEGFVELHPKHEKTAYALYRSAKSYTKDTPTALERDLTSAHKALETYTQFLRRFPTVPEVEDAKKDVSNLRQLLANKELDIAQFYFKRKFYDSAQPRYKKVIELYPETLAATTAAEQLKKIEHQLQAQ